MDFLAQIATRRKSVVTCTGLHRLIQASILRAINAETPGSVIVIRHDACLTYAPVEYDNHEKIMKLLTRDYPIAEWTNGTKEFTGRLLSDAKIAEPVRVVAFRTALSCGHPGEC